MKSYNTSITKFFYDLFSLKGESPPEVISDYIQPVIDVLPPPNFFIGASAINSTGVTVYTVPNDRDFYLYGVDLSLIKDVTATSTLTNVLATVNGVAGSINQIIGLTLTAQADSKYVCLSKPLKLDKGTNITLNNTTNVGNVSARCVIIGYLED